MSSSSQNKPSEAVIVGSDSTVTGATAGGGASPDAPTTKEILWLVKSGDRVLGPFSTAEVSRKLRTKELVVIDEVIAPQSRWKHIRDEATFAPVVDEIRKGLMTARDDTEAGTRTPIIGREEIEDPTPRPTERIQVRDPKSGDEIQDAEIVSETESRKTFRDASVRDVGGSRPGVHSTLSYTPPISRGGVTPVDDEEAVLVISKTSKALWGVVAAALVVIIAAIAVIKMPSGKKASPRIEDVQRMRSAADSAWNQGEYQRALKLYEQYNKEYASDMDGGLETQLRQAILTLRVDRQTLNAKRRLEELLPKLPTSEMKIRARIAMAVSHLQADEPIDAQNELLAIVREPDAGPIAFFNLACAQAASGLRNEAIQTLKKVENHATLELPSRLLRALLFLKDGSAKQAALALDVSHPEAIMAWRQEFFALGAVADFLDGNKRRALARLRIAIDTDPMQSELFFYDPLIYLESIRWKNWLSYVDDFSDRAKTVSAKALLAMALIKSDQKQEAQSVITETLGSRVSDPDLQSVNAYLFMTQGRDDEARGALRFARGEKSPGDKISAAVAQSQLASIMEARLCERASDRTCADTVWGALAKRESPPLAAMVSQARIEMQVSREKGAPLVERLKSLYPNSTPVIELINQTSEAK